MQKFAAVKRVDLLSLICQQTYIVEKQKDVFYKID